jgi:hypothetical protein
MTQKLWKNAVMAYFNIRVLPSGKFNRQVGGVYYLHGQGRRTCQASNLHLQDRRVSSVSKQASSIFVPPFLPDYTPSNSWRQDTSSHGRETPKLHTDQHTSPEAAAWTCFLLTNCNIVFTVRIKSQICCQSHDTGTLRGKLAIARTAKNLSTEPLRFIILPES